MCSSLRDDKSGFLILTVKVGSGFWIDDVYIGINKIKGSNEVSIAINASKMVIIDRKTPYKKDETKTTKPAK